MVLSEKGYAKINLTLSIGERREDGFHNLTSLVIFVELADHIDIHLNRALNKDTRLTQKGAFVQNIAKENNLAYQAAAFMGVKADIVLQKNIPAQAGLGGGSADAAAVIRALARHQKKTISPKDLFCLGADLPACFLSQPLFMSGAGEHVELIEPLPPFWCLLAKPNIAISTHNNFARLGNKKPHHLHPKPPVFKKAEDLFSFCTQYPNDFTNIVPQSVELISLLKQKGALCAGMSGSGATCFALYSEPDSARKGFESLRDHPHLWLWWGAPHGLSQA